MNSVAFFTYKIKFTDLKSVSFMVYTYIIQGWGQRDRTMGLADDAGARKEGINSIL